MAIQRVAIVGSGPAGFYAASRLLSNPALPNIRVDLFEYLPIPFGLSRFGVAADHPAVKNCEHKFEETAKDPRFRFFGNIKVIGTTDPSPTTSLASAISLGSLRPHYDATLLTYGAAYDRLLNIPGESNLRNVISARSFVNWYNGHPYQSSRLSPMIDLSKLQHVTIIGQGNVAIDVARILLKPVDELRATDLPEYVLAELSRSKIKRVNIVGRRGPLQLACTTKELREMMNLPGVGFEMDQDLLKTAQADLATATDISQSRMKKRIMSLLETGSKSSIANSAKSWSLEFLKSPIFLLPADAPPFYNRVGSVVYGINQMNTAVPSSEGVIDPINLSAKKSGKTTSNKTDMVLRSVGYRSGGMADVPFDDDRGVVLNKDGRVTSESGEVVKGLYASGWLARGPNGVIATTMFDAFATADLLASDLTSSLATTSERPDIDIKALTSQRVVNWVDWERIDAEERRRGNEMGKVREKMTDTASILQFLDA